MTTLAPKPGFDWRRVTWGRPDSPSSALCSYCADSVGNDDIPLVLWSKSGHAAQFCRACQEKWWGLKCYDGPNDDEGGAP